MVEIQTGEIWYPFAFPIKALRGPIGEQHRVHVLGVVMTESHHLAAYIIADQGHIERTYYYGSSMMYDQITLEID